MWTCFVKYRVDPTANLLVQSRTSFSTEAPINDLGRATDSTVWTRCRQSARHGRYQPANKSAD